MTDKREITPHKGGRTEVFRARCTPEEKAMLETLAQEHGANMSDLLIGMIRALNDLPVIEAHALIFGVTAWAHDGDPEMGRTVVLFGDGTRIDTHDSTHPLFALDDIADFMFGDWFDTQMADWHEDPLLLLHYVECPHCGSGQTKFTGDEDDNAHTVARGTSGIVQDRERNRKIVQSITGG